MSIKPRRTSYGHAANRSALLTEHGVGDGIGCTLTAAAFTGKPGVADNIVPALYPVVVDADGKATPYAGGELSGFTINPVDISNGDDSDGYIWHGALDPSKLPIPFDPATVTGSGASRFYFNGKA